MQSVLMSDDTKSTSSLDATKNKMILRIISAFNYKDRGFFFCGLASPISRGIVFITKIFVAPLYFTMLAFQSTLARSLVAFAYMIALALMFYIGATRMMFPSATKGSVFAIYAVVIWICILASFAFQG